MSSIMKEFWHMLIFWFLIFQVLFEYIFHHENDVRNVSNGGKIKTMEIWKALDYNCNISRVYMSTVAKNTRSRNDIESKFFQNQGLFPMALSPCSVVTKLLALLKVPRAKHQ